MHIKSDHANDFVGMLNSIGNTIEELMLYINDNTCIEVMDNIQKHCPRLCKIYLAVGKSVSVENWRNRYVSLLCSYHIQLINAKVTQLGNEKYVN